MKNFKKITLFLALIFAVSGCVSPSPKNEKSKIDPSLENVKDVKFISDVKTIAFEWKPLRDTKVIGLNIYRGENEESLRRVGQTKTRYATHYIDKDLEPNKRYVYRFATFTKEGLESVQSDTLNLKTRDVLGPVRFIEAIDNLPEQIKIIFKPHGDFRVNGYIIQKRTPTDPEWDTIETIEGRLNAEFIDVDLEHGKHYNYRIIGTTYEGYNTKPSKSVSAKTRKLPPMVRGVYATTDKPKKIIIRWNKVSKNININYNIYRSESLDGTYKLVKSNWAEESIIDNVKDDGVVFFYKVASVDEYGLESPLQQIGMKGNSIAKPLPPQITYSAIEGGTAVIRWDITDSRNDTFIVNRSFSSTMFKGGKDRTQPMTKKEHRDAGLTPGASYTYSVTAVDEFGIESLPSEPVTLKYKKSSK